MYNLLNAPAGSITTFHAMFNRPDEIPSSLIRTLLLSRKFLCLFIFVNCCYTKIRLRFYVQLILTDTSLRLDTKVVYIRFIEIDGNI